MHDIGYAVSWVIAIAIGFYIARKLLHSKKAPSPSGPSLRPFFQLCLLLLSSSPSEPTLGPTFAQPACVCALPACLFGSLVVFRRKGHRKEMLWCGSSSCCGGSSSSFALHDLGSAEVACASQRLAPVCCLAKGSHITFIRVPARS